MRRLIACLVLLAGLTGLCRAAEDPALQRVVEATVSAYVLPAYDTLHRQTTVLVETVDKFCRSPSSNNADAARAAFSEVLSAWAAVDFLRIGPMAQGGRYERFAFWPDVHGTGARQLRQFLARRDESLLDLRALAEQSAAVQGLPALESLLFSGSKALRKSAPPDPYRCALALAISRNADLIAAETAAAWRAEWASILTTPGPGNPVYRSPDEAMTEILRAVLTGLEQLRDHRLVPVLGDASKPALASRAAYNPSVRLSRISGPRLPRWSSS